MLSCGVRLSLPSPPSLLLRKQYLSLRELFQSQRDKHCSRSERGGLSAEMQTRPKAPYGVGHGDLMSIAIATAMPPVKTANPPP